MEEKALYQELAARVGAPGSKRIADIFAMIADANEARLLAATPGTLEELAARMGQPPEAVRSLLQVLFRKGLIFISEKPQGAVYRMPRSLVQFRDASILWPEAPKSFLNAWREFSETEYPRMVRAKEQGGGRPGMRVIAVDRAIESSAGILPYDAARSMIKNADSLAVVNCVCRVALGNCDMPRETCLQLNKGAEYALKRGTGRPLTQEEALKILDEAEELGLVHSTDNQAGRGNIICNCCADCCLSLTMLIKYGNQGMDPSRFQARVDPELCQGCEICLDRCLFGAIYLEDDTARVREEKCLGCGLCATTCPGEAITLKETRPAEFIPAPRRPAPKTPSAAG